MITLTKQQRTALYRIWLRTQEETGATPQPPTYRQFRQQIRPNFGCIMVPFAGMWLGIEPDGYTHS